MSWNRSKDFAQCKKMKELFHARDLIQSGGTYYGTNKLTKNIIMGDRKKPKNSNAVFFGHTGSGKFISLKITEIGQTKEPEKGGI